MKTPLILNLLFLMFSLLLLSSNMVGQERSDKLLVVPGQGIFSIGTTRKAVEDVLGQGVKGTDLDDVYYVEYRVPGVHVAYEKAKDTVREIFLYNKYKFYERFSTPDVRTSKNITWQSTAQDVLKAYGKPKRDLSGSDLGSTALRRLKYAGIDFLFERGVLIRIGILRPDSL